MTVDIANTKDSVNLAAYETYKRWRRWVEYEDVTQQLWMWLASVWPDAAAWEAKKLMSGLRNAGERYARKEKAAKAGYSPADEYFYSFGKLEQLIFDAFDPEATPTREPYRDDELYSEWVTEVADVRAAIRKKAFPLPYYNTLRKYVTDPNRKLDDTVRSAIWALQRQLGGSRPR